MTTQTRVDPVLFELIKHGLEIVCDEMAGTLTRAAYSQIVRESRDYSTALLTPGAEVLAQGKTNALHLGSMQPALEAMLSKFGDDIQPGDVFINNDPYEGGSHLPDFFVVKPIFVDGKLAAFAGAEAHMSDIGGRVAGGNACDSTEIYQEGLRVPPSYLYFRGKPNQTLWDIIEKNVRQSNRVIGDIRALVAALTVGERGFMKYVEKYGYERLRFCIDEIMNYTERVTRAEIASWPDGEYFFEDALDDDGLDPNLMPIRLKLTVKGDEVEMDFTGSAPQARGALNTPATFIKAACFLAVRSAIEADLPHNSGFTRPIKFNIPEATVLNARPPAAVAARALPAFRTTNVVIGALARIVPHRMVAADEGGNALVTHAGTDPKGRSWVICELFAGAWGGRHDRDGCDGIGGARNSQSNTPCEILEMEYPLLVERYGFAQDACGAGTFRGGLGLIREYRMLLDNTMVQVRTDRTKTRTYGLFGGKPGTHQRNVLNPGPNQRELASRSMIWLKAGDVYRCQLGGAGGWGDPLERDPALVQHDVRNEKISDGFAAREHGVVVDPLTGAVDEEATARLRAELRAGRG